MAKTAQEIVNSNVVPNMETIDDIYKLNNSNQENFLWSVLRVELKSCYEHMKDQMKSKNNPFTWEQQVETLGDIYNPIDFLEHLSAVIMNYRVKKENIDSLKEIIVKYLSSLKNIPKK